MRYLAVVGLVVLAATAAAAQAPAPTCKTQADQKELCGRGPQVVHEQMREGCRHGLQ